MQYHDFRGNKISTLGFGVMRLPKDPEDPDILSRITIRSTKKYVEEILARYERYCKEGEVK